MQRATSNFARAAPVAGIILVGATMGWWMFAARGMALFGGIAGAVLLGYWLIGRRAETVAPALALVLAAVAMHSASTLGWGGADAPDGTRFKASPVGLSHVLTPNRYASETEDCGWYAASGYAAPCPIAPAGVAAFRRLRAVYPLTLLAAGLGGFGALLSLRRSLSMWQRVAAAGAMLAAALSVALFASSAQPALAPLAGLHFGVGGTLGLMQVAVAVLLYMTVATAPGRASMQSASLRPTAA